MGNIKEMTKEKILEGLTGLRTNKARVDWMHSEIEQMRKNFEEASDIIENKMQKLISEFFSETLDLPKEIQHYAQLGMRYAGWIERFKYRSMIDEGIVNGEARELLYAARAEIKKLRAEKSRIIRDTASTRQNMKEMKIQLYAWQESEKLETESQRKQARKLCEGSNLTKNKVNTIIQEVKKNAKK